MEIKCGGGHRIKVFKISIALIVILAFCLSFLLPDKNAWAANSSLSFDGKTYVSVPSNDTLKPATQITIEAWALIAPKSTAYKTIVSKGHDGFQQGAYSLRVTRDTEGCRAFLGINTTRGRGQLFSSSGVTKNKWVHIAGVYDGSQMYIYFNGILNNSKPFTGTLTHNNINVGIGAYFSENGGFAYETWCGNIDEVRIWNVARTQEEIQQDMNHELSGNEPGLVAYWNMNEGDGAEVKDLAGNNNGTIHGNIDWQDGAPITEFSVPLDVPENLDAVLISSNSVDLTWQANTEEDLAGYRVYRDNVKIADVEKTSTSYTDNTVLPGTTYTYEITAYNTSNQESAKSSPVTVTVPPGTPTEVTAQATGKEVALNWQGPGNQQFIVERSSDGTKFTQVAEVTEAYFSETAPMWETTYYYRVAQKGQDNRVSAFSEPIQVTTEIVPVPANLKAVLDGNNVNLSWDAVQGVDGYLIEKSIDNETWETLTTVTTNSYTDQVTDPNAKCFYRVRSDGGNDQLSEPSAATEITTPAPEAPRITYVVDNTDVELSWNHQRSADGYRVYINDSLAAEVDTTNYTFTGERGKSYTIKIEAYNAYGKASSAVNVSISEIPTPGSGTMAKDVLKYTGVTLASTGGLLALGLALKGSPGLVAILRSIFRV